MSLSASELAAVVAELQPLVGGTVQKIRVPSPRVAILRSEEHTSELQSLTDISYAVFWIGRASCRERVLTDV